MHREKRSSSSSSSFPLAMLKRPSQWRMLVQDPHRCSSWLAMAEFSCFLLSSLSLFCFYFLPEVSFIVKASVCYQLQTPLINLLAYELVSTSSVRHQTSGVQERLSDVFSDLFGCLPNNKWGRPSDWFLGCGRYFPLVGRCYRMPGCGIHPIPSIWSNSSQV